MVDCIHSFSQRCLSIAPKECACKRFSAKLSVDVIIFLSIFNHFHLGYLEKIQGFMHEPLENARRHSKTLFILGNRCHEAKTNRDK